MGEFFSYGHQTAHDFDRCSSGVAADANRGPKAHGPVVP